MANAETAAAMSPDVRGNSGTTPVPTLTHTADYHTGRGASREQPQKKFKYVTQRERLAIVGVHAYIADGGDHGMG